MKKIDDSQHTCFVISPIGDAGSDIRKAADDLFDLVINPSLKPYSIEVIRADKIVGSNMITNDIINLVQNSELCIIDLTGNNPNVFYECGRRHETGKPFIQLIRAKEKIPFDVAGIRTIEYDLSSPRSVLDTINNIQLFMDEIVSTGFTSYTSGFSLGTISDTLERIERKISNLAKERTTWTSSTTSYSSNLQDPLNKLKIAADPYEGLNLAIKIGDLNIAETSLQNLYKKNENPYNYIKWCGIFASMGDRVAFDIMVKLMERDDFDFTKLDELDTYIIHFYNSFSKFKEYQHGFNLMVPKLIDLVENDPNLEAKIRMTSYEVLALFYSGVKDYENAVKFGDKALAIAPNDQKIMLDMIYYYEQLEDFEKAEKIAHKVLKNTDHEIEDYSTFETIITTFFKAGKKDEAERLLEEYKFKFPTMYTSYLNIIAKYRK